MLNFLKLLKEAPATRLVSARAAKIIVTQFKHNLLGIHIVRRILHLDGPRINDCIHNACRADAQRVLLRDDLPTSMFVKSCLSMSFQLKLLWLYQEIAKELLRRVKLVHATTHSG